MASDVQAPEDLEDRRVAITVHDRSILVEAGAGSGKTAVMAGRVAALLAAGVEPRAIAAVTFTELAASELLGRVRKFVDDLRAGTIATELKIAFPDGLSDAQKQNLDRAAEALDEIVCGTIHGFCQRLIKPYPVEAGIDPGAGVMDAAQADLAFEDVLDAWKRDVLASADGGLLADLVVHDVKSTLALVDRIADTLRKRRDLTVTVAEAPAAAAAAFVAEVDELVREIDASGIDEPETCAIADALQMLAARAQEASEQAAARGAVQIVTMALDDLLFTQDGKYRAFKKKGKWVAAGRSAGLSKTQAELSYANVELRYEACGDAWARMRACASSHVLGGLVALVTPVLQRYRDYKRGAALLDFDDLLFAARDLLRDHDEVRRALAERHQYVLVDEFQDTDPLQTEIFWRLCGEPLGASNDWASFAIRPGALFLVGDPKQAIYRFRGADVGAYAAARTCFQVQDGAVVLSISTNFRSCAPVLTHVNACFAPVLSQANQPGFTPLSAFRPPREGTPSVTALDVRSANEDGKTTADRLRDAEAEAVAQACARLIGVEMVLDKATGTPRPCRPGDIALLAPTGTDLWRYEEALESLGIPVATQAGKGFFRRQEVQDLIAITRVLADSRDRLALGALLRGPLVGLTEDALLDLVWNAPRSPERQDAPVRLSLHTDYGDAVPPLAREVLEKLRTLAKKKNSCTPQELVSQAVDMLRVRAVLMARHPRQAERALANVDRYLGLAAAFAVRGLRAFAEWVDAQWREEARAGEGRPDAQDDAVALFTMHAAKGLEWPIVIPVNTSTKIMPDGAEVVDRTTGTFHCRVFDVDPVGFEAAHAAEAAERAAERARLWYVAATRAREMLILPRHDGGRPAGAWISVVDLALDELPALDLDGHDPWPGARGSNGANLQTREVFAQEAAEIAGRQRSLAWRTPSRSDAVEGAQEGPRYDLFTSDEDTPAPDVEPAAGVRGGRERGTILHKLFEEVLTGELDDTIEALTTRAGELAADRGVPVHADPAQGLSADEVARCVQTALELPDVAGLRPRLVAETTIYRVEAADAGEEVTFGIADAIALGEDGAAEVVIDWKSDVSPTAETIAHYRDQVGAYLQATGAQLGLIVLASQGRVIQVRPANAE